MSADRPAPVEVWAIETDADAMAAWAVAAPLTEGILLPFGTVHAEELSFDGCLSMLAGLERTIAHLQAQQARVLARMVADPPTLPPLPPPADATAAERAAHVAKDAARRAEVGQLSAREEIAQALRWSHGTTCQRVDAAEQLVSQLPATLAALETGTISYPHVQGLLRATQHLDQPTTAAVEARVLGRAGSQTPAEFRSTVRRAAAAADPRGEADRHADAVEDRRVAYSPDEHAMAWITAYLPAPDAQQVLLAVQAVADKLKTGAEPDDPRTADQYRADALVTLCVAALNGQMIDGLPEWHGRHPHVQLLLPLATALGLSDQPGELAGYGPVPAELARRIAADPTGTWHRLVVDSTGVIVDYGRSTYRPPQDLTDLVIARDRVCRVPGCNRAAARCDLDHLHQYAHGGDTSAVNLEARCQRHHILRHQAGWRVHREPDGTSWWISPTGRRYTKPPDIHEPDHQTGQDQQPDRQNGDPDPPPF